MRIFFLLVAIVCLINTTEASISVPIKVQNELISNAEEQDEILATFHEDLIVLLLENKGDIAYVKKNGDSYLHRVAGKKGKDNLVKIFIEAGIDVNIKNKDGQTPLHLAVRSGKANVASVQALVDGGADVNAKTNKGKSIFQRTNNKAAKEIIEAAGGVK